jgi:hypothetical protein
MVDSLPRAGNARVDMKSMDTDATATTSAFDDEVRRTVTP